MATDHKPFTQTVIRSQISLITTDAEGVKCEEYKIHRTASTEL